MSFLVTTKRADGVNEPRQAECSLARGSRWAGNILLALRRAVGRVGTKLEGRIGRVVHASRVRFAGSGGNTSDGIGYQESTVIA